MASVLVVDDSLLVRRTIEKLLVGQGYEVRLAASPEQALEQAFREPPSVVLTDLRMPGISGVQLCRLLRAEASTASVPVVLLTASADRRSRFWAQSAGAQGYVSKTELPELVQVLARVVGAPVPPTSLALMEPLTGGVHQRLAQLLDGALFASVIAGEIRSLARHDEASELFRAFSGLASGVLSYRWLALSREGEGGLFLHGPADSEALRAEVRGALPASKAVPQVFCDDLPGEGLRGEVLLRELKLGSRLLGRLALAPRHRGLPLEENTFLDIAARELPLVLRTLGLVEDARRLAATDALTGLLNRRAFTEAMERELARCLRHQLPLSLLLLDVDHFKRTNDTFGHTAGDRVLKEVAAQLLRSTRKSDLVARWGGEEFVVALPQTAAPGAALAAERIRASIEACVISFLGQRVPVTASLGVASLAASSLDELIARADAAMYDAKRQGRNRVVLAAEPGLPIFCTKAPPGLPRDMAHWRCHD
jgi:two-component system cell cycle response regulator